MGNILSGVCCTCDPSCTADPSINPPNTDKYASRGDKVSDNLLNITQEGPQPNTTTAMMREREKEKEKNGHTQFRFALNDQPMSVTPDSSRMTTITKSESTLSRQGDDDSLNIGCKQLAMSPRSVIIDGENDNSIPDIPEVTLQTNKITPSDQEPKQMDGTIALADVNTIHGNLQSHTVHAQIQPVHTQIHSHPVQSNSGYNHAHNVQSNSGFGHGHNQQTYTVQIHDHDHHQALPQHHPIPLNKPRSKANLFRDQTDRVWDESDMEDLEEEMKMQMESMSQLITPSAAATPHSVQTPMYTTSPHNNDDNDDNDADDDSEGSEDHDNEEYMNATSTMRVPVTHLDIDRRGSNLVQTSSCDWDSSELEREESHIKRQIRHLKSNSDINSSQ